MFTWICPKCGKEVPPSYSECPNCEATGQAAAAGQPAAPASAPPANPVPPRTAAARPQHVGVPGWILSIVFAALFVGLGVGAFFLFRSAPAQPAAPQPAAAFETPATQVAASAQQSNPALRNLELTGLRLTEDKRQKAYLQFVVVNHSGADLGEVGAKVELRSTKAGPADPPVGTFAFKTSLGPYEAKDVKAPIETKLRVYELPDWQFLRTEIIGQ